MTKAWKRRLAPVLLAGMGGLFIWQIVSDCRENDAIGFYRESPSRLFLVLVLSAVSLAGVVTVERIQRWREDAKRNAPPSCAACGYNLTGNISGVCPECGRQI